MPDTSDRCHCRLYHCPVHLPSLLNVVSQVLPATTVRVRLCDSNFVFAVAKCGPYSACCQHVNPRFVSAGID